MNISRTIPIFLIGTILVFGTTISMGIPTSFAEPQYNYDKNQQYNSYGKDYDKKKASDLNLQKVNCDNIIINGVNSAAQGTTGGEDMLDAMAADDGEDGTGQWLENGDYKKSNKINENIVNFCKNKHNKIVLAAEEPEPTTGSLTVPKQIFGCNDNNPNDELMDCQSLGPDSEEWISCDNPNDFDNPDFCALLGQNLNLFDIEVTDQQDNPVVPTFTGSQAGTTIPDLVPGTYTVNEIVHDPGGQNQLNFHPTLTPDCTNNEGFVSGGILNINPPGPINYIEICFEIEDEQGEDCSTTSIAAGETRTCIVKNYIVLAQDDSGPL